MRRRVRRTASATITMMIKTSKSMGRPTTDGPSTASGELVEGETTVTVVVELTLPAAGSDTVRFTVYVPVVAHECATEQPDAEFESPNSHLHVCVPVPPPTFAVRVTAVPGVGLELDREI